MTEVTITEQIGGADAAVALGDTVRTLRQAFKQLNDKTYSSQIEKFKFYLMVSGEITKFEDPSGCTKLRLMKKQKAVNADLVLGKEVWKGADRRAIKQFLARAILAAFEMAIAKIKKEKIEIKEDELINDVKNVLKDDLG